ncbi:PD40 domain-containing protein, partial [candidate division FCPU426 bacterium]|nr:PD40 domain-containing protein [candidate division FCPU426 bacterium]
MMNNSYFRLRPAYWLLLLLLSCLLFNGCPKKDQPQTPATAVPTPIPEQYRILYTSGSQLYLTNLAGDTVEKISAAGKSIWFPTVSPDNQKIAYWSSASGFFELWVYGIQQKIPQQLTFFNEKTTQTILRNFNVHNAPAWTPDSKRIIFSHLGKIWSVDATGFNLETLVPLGFHFSPALSADGKFLVYISEIDQYRNLFVRQLSTGDEWPVTQFPASHLVGSPSWSPNGKHIAFTVSFFEKADIWMVDIDGTGLKRLTKDGYSNSPAWAPAGERIAFSSGRQDPYRWEIWVMNQDGSSQFCVTRNGGFSPAWLGGGTAPPLPAAVFIPTPVIRQTPMVQPTHTQVVVTVESRPTIRPTLPLPPTPKPTVAPTPKTIPAAKVRPTPVLAPTPSRKKAAAAPTPAATAGKARDKKIPVQTATQISAGKQTVAAKGTAPATIVEDSYEDYEKFEEYADEDQVVLPPEAL